MLATALNSLVKMNGFGTHLTLALWTNATFQHELENIDELKKVLELIWDQPPPSAMC